MGYAPQHRQLFVFLSRPRARVVFQPHCVPWDTELLAMELQFMYMYVSVYVYFSLCSNPLYWYLFLHYGGIHLISSTVSEYMV